MGQYSGTMPNDLILNLVYPKILDVSPWEDQTQLFQSLEKANK
jgi:hypothetical protein